VSIPSMRTLATSVDSGRCRWSAVDDGRTGRLEAAWLLHGLLHLRPPTAVVDGRSLSGDVYYAAAGGRVAGPVA
jgi:hypothetical protein